MDFRKSLKVNDAQIPTAGPGGGMGLLSGQHVPSSAAEQPDKVTEFLMQPQHSSITHVYANGHTSRP